MTCRPHRPGIVLSLILIVPGLAACGDESSEAAAPETAAALAAAPAPGAATPAAETSAPAEPESDGLPEPTEPASWSATMDDVTVDGLTIRAIKSTCGSFRALPTFAAVARAATSCEGRDGVVVRGVLASGELTALAVSGPEAACVRGALVGAGLSGDCQFELTLGE